MTTSMFYGDSPEVAAVVAVCVGDGVDWQHLVYRAVAANHKGRADTHRLPETGKGSRGIADDVVQGDMGWTGRALTAVVIGRYTADRLHDGTRNIHSCIVAWCEKLYRTLW